MDRPCSLCWTVINGDNFEIIEEIRREMLEVLLLKLDFSCREGTIVCNNCIEQLEKSFQFKATCLYTEDYIFPLIKENSKIDMRQIYNDNELKIVIIIAPDEDVCRLCMGVFENNYFYTLEEVDRVMLQKYIPEVNLTVVQRPVFCKNCLTSLTCYFHFARICMETDEKMKTFFKYFNKFSNITNNFHIQLSPIKLFTKGKTNKSLRVKVKDLQNVDDEYNSKNRSKLKDTSSDTGDYEAQNNKPLLIKQSSKINEKKQAKEKQIFSCEICSYNCSTKSVLTRHKLNVHEENLSIRIYECDRCSFKSKYKTSLLNHVTVHKTITAL